MGRESNPTPLTSGDRLLALTTSDETVASALRAAYGRGLEITTQSS
jgi:hypothetical protein